MEINANEDNVINIRYPIPLKRGERNIKEKSKVLIRGEKCAHLTLPMLVSMMCACTKNHKTFGIRSSYMMEDELGLWNKI